MAKKDENLFDLALVKNGLSNLDYGDMGLGSDLTGPSSGAGGGGNSNIQGPAQGSGSGGGQQSLVGPLVQGFGEYTRVGGSNTPTTPQAPADTGPTGPVYAGTYEEQLAQLYDEIQNRGAFRYDVHMDPLYENYKDQYIQGGKLAMRDTMGQAAALTGGYGSTYSQAAGQQAYDQYMQQLTDKIPELYDMAYGMYKDKGNELLQQYGMLNDQRNTEYSRYRDEVGDTQWQQQFDAQQEQQAWARQQQQYTNLVAMIQATGYNPSDKELRAAGMTRSQANKLRQAWKKSQKSSGGNGGSGGGGGSRRSSGGSGNYTNSEVAQAAAQGASRAEIEAALRARGVDTSRPDVQSDIDEAMRSQSGSRSGGSR